MKLRLSLGVLILICSIALCACGRNQTEVEGEAAYVPIRDHSPDATIVTVNGHAITAEQVEQETQGLMAQYGGSMPPQQLQMIESQLHEQAVENLITKYLLLQEAGKRNIEPGEQDIAAEIETLTGQFPKPEMFQEQLAAMGISPEQLHRDVADYLKIKAVIVQATADVPDVTAQDVDAFYAENEDTFKVGEQVRASHVLARVEQDVSEETRAMKRKEIEEARERLAGGADFAQVAREYSDCPSSERGGELGLFERGQMVEAFEDVAFKLTPGEVSPVVETQFGYHVITVTEHKEARTVELDEVRDEIAGHLKNTRSEAVVESFMQKLRQAARIEYARQ